jgi:hypothetical protein
VIQSLPCPGCHRTLVLAADASLQAVLRCRHCSHQFVLGEMIQAELGYWEVVDDPNALEPKSSPIRDEAEEGAEADHTDLALAESEESEAKEYDSPQTLIKKHPENRQLPQNSVDWSKFEPIHHEQYERMRRKGKSPIWSMLSVLLGGLASIPIATLLIWHLLGKDPLQMGPVVGRYAPWIVPARFQSHQPDFAASERMPAPPAGASGFPRFDHLMNSADPDSSTPDSAKAAPTDAVPQANSVPPSAAKRPGGRQAPGAFPTPSDLPADDANEGVKEIVGTSQIPSQDTSPSILPSASEGNVFAMIHQVEKDLEAWSERGEDREVHKKLAQQTYSDLSALAVAIEQLPAGSPMQRLVRTELHAVGRSVAQGDDVQQLIQAGSRYWITHHQADERIGLALMVEVAETSEVGNVWQIKATPATAIGTPSLIIAVPKEVAPTLSPGMKFFVLGCVLPSQADSETPKDSDPPTVRTEPQLAASFVLVLEP